MAVSFRIATTNETPAIGNTALADIFIEMAKKKNPIHLLSFIRIRSLYYPNERQKLKNEIWNLIENDSRFTYERTSEIFITKGLKCNERFLDFLPRERQGSIDEGAYISHLVVRKNIS